MHLDLSSRRRSLKWTDRIPRQRRKKLRLAASVLQHSAYNSSAADDSRRKSLVRPRRWLKTRHRSILYFKTENNKRCSDHTKRIILYTFEWTRGF
ncbi:hypothetical protein AVEN_192952-1 [Araneus ventricosus]|uniref:Uncharacterized protein n=1 Tax=Araneus ventricosus TaxID=182803 RepID=A0A4Y2KE36_ARAVE|nr:hypothetical protein AVEN_192952-1 [Araneus ventricosus]